MDEKAEPIETISRVAIRYNDRIFTVNRPDRHGHLIHAMALYGMGPEAMYDQGFLTSNSRFVDRTEGCSIAIAANQIINKTNPDNELFSEDMW